MARFIKLFRYVIFFFLFASAVHYLVQHKSFIFSPKQLRAIAEKYTGQHPTQCLQKLTTDLRRQYHPHVLLDSELKWIPFASGGHHGKILLLHGSFTEFLALIGTPSKSSGSLGVHWQNFTCSILVGSVHRWKDGALTPREEHGPGDNFRQYMFETSFVETSEDTWMLCYGRGVMPASGPWFLGNTLLSAWDPISAVRFLTVYGQSYFRESALWIEETFNYYTKQYFGK